MKFRPCIDIHNGKVKQIVGGSLKDAGNKAQDNFVSELEADYYSRLYASYGLRGGHIILLNPEGSAFYEADCRQAGEALKAYPQGLMIGGGIHPENAEHFLDLGASHVIVTSYVFHDGMVDYERLEELVKVVGKERLVLDLSCKKVGDEYLIVTDRWQKVTKEVLNENLLNKLMAYCDEFLIHAVDVEGKAEGIEEELVSILGSWGKIPVTYAGGVHNYEDLGKLKSLGQNKLHVTIGSALDLFGGKMVLEEVLKQIREN
jgi:phosphoribosylformimino-5-aminoimidazole carboxamide ribotide isomerase